MRKQERPKADLNGKRVIFQSKHAIYLVDRGFLRHVPDPDTYNNLFRDWNNLERIIEVGEIPRGKPISPGAYLAKAAEANEVYFVERGIKRHVVNPDAMDKYYFDWTKIRQVSPSELKELLDGPPIE